MSLLPPPLLLPPPPAAADPRLCWRSRSPMPLLLPSLPSPSAAAAATLAAACGNAGAPKFSPPTPPPPLPLQVRIPAWTVRRGVPPLHLAIGKSAVLAAGSAAALAVEAGRLAAHGRATAQLWPCWRRSPAGWALICWSALGPGALSAFLHVQVSGVQICTNCGSLGCLAG